MVEKLRDRNTTDTHEEQLELEKPREQRRHNVLGLLLQEAFMVVWSSRSSLKADVKPRTLMTDSLVIKNFLRKIITVLPKIRFNFSVKVNGILSVEIFGAESEPALNLSNGIALVVNCQHYLRGFPGQKMELWGVHTLLSAHLRAILRESHSVVQGCIQAAVARALEQHRQAVKAHQKLQASLSVAVDSIMSIMTGSTNSSFRKTCLQTLQVASPFWVMWVAQGIEKDTILAILKLALTFILTGCEILELTFSFFKQLLPERNEAEQNTDKAHENGSLELLAGTGEQTENKRLKRGSLGVEETGASRSAGALSPSEAASRRAEPTAAPLTFSRSRTGPGSGLEDAVWLQEISNLSEWLSSGPGP
ncbi:hypothetical protein JEQ12_011294 [Ovis aries]|uniref:Uncharacterized protein n=1 Tax=Ovis aries TaxID=9940 RepID=A0A835ZUS8_SHEEP|nr:hypothetical protein JEQ12_011294 [Ovis aries]